MQGGNARATAASSGQSLLSLPVLGGHLSWVQMAASNTFVVLGCEIYSDTSMKDLVLCSTDQRP